METKQKLNISTIYPWNNYLNCVCIIRTTLSLSLFTRVFTKGTSHTCSIRFGLEEIWGQVGILRSLSSSSWAVFVVPASSRCVCACVCAPDCIKWKTLHLTLPLSTQNNFSVLVLSVSPSNLLSLSHTHRHTPHVPQVKVMAIDRYWHDDQHDGHQPLNTQRGKSLWSKYPTTTLHSGRSVRDNLSC